MKCSLIGLLAIILSGMVSMDLSAQNHSYTHYTTEDGLPSNYVYGVIEDDEGYIWAYTENGIAKFDGYDWTVFTTQNGLPNNDVFFMIKDKWGRLWCTNMAYRIAYIEKDSIFTPLPKQKVTIYPYLTEGKVSLGFSQSAEYAIADSSSILKMSIPDKLWNTVYFRNQDSTAWALHPFFFINDSWISIQSDNRIVELKDGKKTIKNLKGLELINPRWFSLNGYRPSNPPHRNPFIALFDEQKVFVHDFKTDYSEVLDFNELGIGIPADMQVDHSGNDSVYFNTENEYIFFDSLFNVTEIYSPWSIADQYVLRRLFIDSQGNRWIGTKEGGLFKINSSALKTEMINAPNIQGTEGIFKEIISTKNGLFVISENMALFKIEDDQLSRIRSESGIQVRHTVPYKKGHLIMHSEQLQFLDGNNVLIEVRSLSEFQVKEVLNGQFTGRTEFFNRAFANMKTGAMDEKNSTLYYSNQQACLSFNMKTGSISEIKATRSRCMKLDSLSGSLWLEEGNVLQRWDGQELHNVSTLPDIISYIHCIGHDALLVGTENAGLYLITGKGSRKLRIADLDYTRNIIEKHGVFFIASNDGIAVLVGGVSEFQERYRYTTKDGLLTNEIQDIHIEGNSLYAASHKGLMKIDLKAEIKGPDLSRTIDVLSINLGSHDLFELNEPCVDHDQNDLNVVYHFNDYASNGDITYSYRLLPLDETWRSTSDRSLTYSDLNPGTYQFELTAFDAYGKEYSISSPIRFEIEKAWWQMNVFKGLALFSFIGLTFYFVKRREKQQRALIEHERELNKRIADLQMQSLRSQMNPHFIFNSLGSIQYYIQTNKVDEADNYLTLFAQLMRRYLNSAIENMISLREEVSLLYEYTTLEMMRFDFNFKTSIHVSEDIDRESEFIPSMLVQPFVENAINHGLQLRKGNGGLLDIDFSKSDGNLICTISDNGIGIKRSKERVNQNHISRGMENVRNRVSVLKTSSVADISISAEELHPGTEYPGTKVTLLIKKKDEDEV